MSTLNKSSLLNTIVAISVLLFAIITQASAKSYNQDITLLKQVLQKAHPGYKRYASQAELNRLWAELEQSTQNPSYNELAFYADVSKVLAALRCEHTKAELPKNIAEQKRNSFLPFTFKIFDQRMFVDRSFDDKLKKGDEITHINGKSIPQAIVQLRDYIAIDGYTEHTINAKITNDFDLMGSGFEQFFAPVVLETEAYPNMFSISVSRKNKPLQMNLNSIDFKSWIALGNRPYRLDFKDAVTLKKVGKSAALLKVDTFVNYRQPIDAEELFSDLFKSLKEEKVTTLIVDLRRNGGGSDDAQLALMKHLYNSPFQLVKDAWVSKYQLGETAEQLRTWDRRILSVDKNTLNKTPMGYQVPLSAFGSSAKLHQPAKNAFTGEIIMLSSVNNASASAALLSHISQQSNVTIIGEKTGGNQGGTTASIIGFLTLPASKIVVRIPLIRNQYNLDIPKDGFGALPDIEISQTYEDWLENKDSILELALSKI